MIGIYKITNLINGKMYVGQSIDISYRWYNHKNELKRKRHCNKYLQSSWDKYSHENFAFEVLEICDADSLNEKEIYWIENLGTYENGYNLSAGGGGGYKYVFTQADREKMTLAQKGNKKWLGKKHSKETKLKMSESGRGRICSKETRLKIKISLTGKKASVEARLKMSQSRKGKLAGDKNPMFGVRRYGDKNPMFGKTGSKCPISKKIISDDLNFGCVNDCALHFDVKYTTMRSYLNGQRKMPERFKNINLRYELGSETN